MVVDFTRITDGMNRPVQVVGETATVTSCIGLLPLMHFVRVSGIYDILQRLISPTLPTCKCRGGRTQFNKFLQRLGGLFIGKEDLIDHDSIGRDPGFMAAMGLPATAGSSCLCRFENMIGEPTIQAMQKVLRQIFLAGFYGRKPDFLWVDIDCTPIYVYGNQENKEYSGHYGDYCLMALVVFVNHYPVWVELDGGCTDGRKMLEKIYLEVISFLKQHFPNTPIAFRADSGFMREDILKELEKQEVLYFIGFAPNCVITKYADNEWKPEVLKAFERDSDHELVLRALGEYREYLPKKWKRDDHPHARLILRDQYAPKPKITRKQRSNPEKEMECDLRCILTNLPREDKVRSALASRLPGDLRRSLLQTRFSLRIEISRTEGRKQGSTRQRKQIPDQLLPRSAREYLLFDFCIHSAQPFYALRSRWKVVDRDGKANA